MRKDKNARILEQPGSRCPKSLKMGQPVVMRTKYQEFTVNYSWEKIYESLFSDRAPASRPIFIIL